MGLLDRAAEMFGNRPPQATDSQTDTPMDPKTRLTQAALSLLSDNGQAGGLHGLMERFQEAGLGNVFSSWIGNEENVPITPEQVKEALGSGHLQQLSEESGLSENETAQHLSDLLPQLVDTLTPAGHIPHGGLGGMADLLQNVIGRFRS